MREPTLDELNEFRDTLLELKSKHHNTLILEMILNRNDMIDRQRSTLADVATRSSWLCNNCGYNYEASGFKEAPEICPSCEIKDGSQGCVLLRPATKDEIKAAIMGVRL